LQLFGAVLQSIAGAALVRVPQIAAQKLRFIAPKLKHHCLFFR
jgi:Sec-independent protein secretion pathway component TatC